jgi:hypothetical protein
VITTLTPGVLEDNFFYFENTLDFHHASGMVIDAALRDRLQCPVLKNGVFL